MYANLVKLHFVTQTYTKTNYCRHELLSKPYIVIFMHLK